MLALQLHFTSTQTGMLPARSFSSPHEKHVCATTAAITSPRNSGRNIRPAGVSRAGDYGDEATQMLFTLARKRRHEYDDISEGHDLDREESPLKKVILSRHPELDTEADAMPRPCLRPK